MSVKELKEQLASLPRKEQDEVVAFLFHLRHKDDADYHQAIQRRSDDSDPANWLSLEEFEKALDRKR